MTGRDLRRCPMDRRRRSSTSIRSPTPRPTQLIVALHPGDDSRCTERGASPVRRHPALHRGSCRQAQRTTPRRGDHGGVPDTLYEALFARLRSSDDALLVVEAAALIGSRIDRALLSSVVELDTSESTDALRTSSRRAGCSQPWTRDSWRFRHELLREVAAELSPPSIRRRLHSRIADALVGVRPTRNPTGRWWHAITSKPSVSTRPHRPTSRRRPTLGSAAHSAKPAPTSPAQSSRSSGSTRAGRVISVRSPLASTRVPRLGGEGDAAPRPPPSSSGAFSCPAATSAMTTLRDLHVRCSLLRHARRSRPGNAVGRVRPRRT